MDGIHDLGGREGFGSIDADEPEVPFHAEWEGRMLGISRSMARAPDWTLDWFRHCRELIDPVDYLSRPYYDQWMQTYAAMMVNSGMATVKEIASGKSGPESEEAGNQLTPPIAIDQFPAVLSAVTRYNRPNEGTPKFKAGDSVRTLKHGKSGHTRLPSYARDRTGTVHSCRGTHVFPDDAANGRESSQPLYTVSFDSAELWGSESPEKLRVFLDLWESYLVPVQQQ